MAALLAALLKATAWRTISTPKRANKRPIHVGVLGPDTGSVWPVEGKIDIISSTMRARSTGSSLLSIYGRGAEFPVVGKYGNELQSAFL